MYVKIVDGRVASCKNKLEDLEWADRRWKGPWDFKSLDEVKGYALYLTAMTGDSYVGVDRTSAVSPRYDVCRVPHVGDEVSKSFNGDSYPDGYVVKVTKNLTVVTSTGSRYRRFKETSGWRKEGGTWWLIQGHHDERNPHF